MVLLKPDSEKWHVRKDYRWSKEPTPEFKYFVERILPAIAPSRNKFNDQKGKKILSEILPSQTKRSVWLCFWMSYTAGRIVRKRKNPINTAEKDSATEEVEIKKVGQIGV